MNIYIAAAFQARDDAHALALMLVDSGHTVTSRWIWGESELTPEWAASDLEDVDDADLLVSLAYHTNSTGGKHVELGYAIGRGKTVIHIGRVENIFHLHPSVIRLQSVEGLFSWLDERTEAKDAIL